MSKKTTTSASTKPSNVSQSQAKTSILAIAFHKNLMAVLVCFILLFVLQKRVSGYNWVWQTLIKENLEMQKKMPNLTEQQKGEAKLGYDITYINFLNENTPKDAVILFPDASVITKDTTADQPKFRTTGGGLYTALWVQYFAFPRKIVFENEKDKNPNYKKITHVAIVNYWGYQFIPYEVDKSNRLGVLPIRKK